jgi:drug/metabolite transporter (DMT)-like permease
MNRMKGNNNNWPWIVATLLAQTGWGAYPVLARYLQTISSLPSMSIIAFGSLLALAVVGVFLFPRMEWKAFRSVRLLLFGLVVVGRGITNFLAARYTLAIYVQLITLSTPFLVALLSTAVLHEKLPRYTGRAVAISLFGAVLIIGGGLFGMDTLPGSNRTDWLGISLALGSSLLLAIYMIAVRSTARYHIKGETLLLAQLFALGVTSGILSLLLGEDWSQWGANQTLDWLAFALLSLGILAGANIAQIGSIRHLGAAMVSSTMAWRLVSALFLAAWMLDERLTSIFQVLGVVLVLTTISWYLWQQRGPAQLRGRAG